MHTHTHTQTKNKHVFRWKVSIGQSGCFFRGIEIDVFSKTVMETLSSHHTSHVINQTLLLAETTKKTTGNGRRWMYFCYFFGVFSDNVALERTWQLAVPLHYNQYLPAALTFMVSSHTHRFCFLRITRKLQVFMQTDSLAGGISHSTINTT